MTKHIMISTKSMAKAVVLNNIYSGEYADTHKANDTLSAEREIQQATNNKGEWLNFWGANIRHVAGGLWQVCGHHEGEEAETIGHLKAAIAA